VDLTLRVLRRFKTTPNGTQALMIASWITHVV